ncbi:MAG: alpha-2-macroglobulin family protein, partial [Acidobacteria bacterium]|nr:alpha-2-macroglobulin family protein [Acidobacteriota bacterium]
MTEQGEPKAGGGFFADWRNGAIVVLAVLLAVVGFYALSPGGGGGGAKKEVVNVFDLVLDRDGRQFVDILFDQPVGEGKVGEVLGEAPATIDPPLAGHWRWLAVNSLRFEPSGGFPIASQYAVTLIPERLLGPDRTLGGDARLVVRTDQFLVESVEVNEEPLLDGEGKVVLRGTIRFNYAVDPETLAPLIELKDSQAEGGKVEVTLEETYWSRPQIGFRTGPVQKQKDERELDLVIDAALTPSEGNVPLGQEFTEKIFVGSRDKLSVREVRSFPGEDESRIEVAFSSPLTAAAARPYVSVAPAVDFRLSASRNRLTLTGPFAPGGRYQLRLGAGLPASDQAVLPEASMTEVRLTDLDPSADFQSQGLFLSAQGPRNLAIETVNVQRVQVAVDRVYQNNLFSLIEYGGGLDTDSTYSGDIVSRSLGDRLTTKTLSIEGQRNHSVTTVLSLGDMVPKDAPGLYRVLLSRPGNWQAEQRWILVTELGAVAKRGKNDFLVWAASSRSLEPAAGAKVTLISDQNQVIGEGRTDASGLWRLGSAVDLEKQRPFLVTVEKGQDWSFLYLDRMAIDTTGLDVSGAEPQGKGYTAFLYGERDLYRPGATVSGVALVRAGDLSTPPTMPAILRHKDPQGRVLGTQKVQLDRRGLAEFSLDLPPYALTGTHSLELEAAEKVLGTYRFQVEEFVPDRIQVSIEPTTPQVVPGQELAYTVQSSYLFGPPAAGLAMETRVRLAPSPFAPAGFAGYTFGDSDRSFEDREIYHQQGTLDDAGKAALEAPVLAVSEVPAALVGIITARVQEAGGRGVTALARVPIHPVPYYLGLKRQGEGYPEPGQEVGFDFVAVSPEGREQASGDLVAELFLERWNTVLRKTPSGSYHYESTRESVPVQQKAIKAGSKRGSVSFKPEDYGQHRLVISDPATGAATSITFYVSGWGYSPWAIENPSHIELDLDRDEYRPGDTATVQVRAPFPGKLLLTVESDRVLDTQIHTLTGNTATIQVPIQGGYRPNAYVTATLVRSSADLEPGGVARAFGAIALPVDRVSNRLATDIEAPEEVRSQTEVTIAVDTAPGAAVTVAAVDEGILQLIAQKTPDPFEFFYRRLALGVISYDSFGLLFPDVEGAKAAGGGDFEENEAQYVRTDGIRRAKPVAFWSGVLTADGAGKVRTKIQLPEFQGAVRIMAVTADGRRFGAASERLRVRDPIVLLPTLPRVLSYGETLRIPVTVRNDTGAGGPMEVRMTVSGSAKVAGEATRSVEIANGAEGTVYFDLETATSGDEIEVKIEA